MKNTNKIKNNIIKANSDNNNLNYIINSLKGYNITDNISYTDFIKTLEEVNNEILNEKKQKHDNYLKTFENKCYKFVEDKTFDSTVYMFISKITKNDDYGYNIFCKCVNICFSLYVRDYSIKTELNNYNLSDLKKFKEITKEDFDKIYKEISEFEIKESELKKKYI